MSTDEAVWVARLYLQTYSDGRVGMMLSDEAVRDVCAALVELADRRPGRDWIGEASMVAMQAQAMDQHIHTHGAAPLVVPEDRSKPPPGYTVEPCPGGLVRWWRNGVECGPPCVTVTAATAEAWVDYGLRRAQEWPLNGRKRPAP